MGMTDEIVLRMIMLVYQRKVNDDYVAGLKQVVQCMIVSVKSIGNIMAVTVLLIFMFGVIGNRWKLSMMINKTFEILTKKVQIFRSCICK